CQHFWSTPLTF
nr:immunoglobulin light chain junction region [Mus musculus]